MLSLLRGALAEITNRPLVWRLILAMTAVQIGLWTMLPYVPIYIGRLAPNNTVTAVGVVLSAVGLGQAVASPLWGVVMPRLGHVSVLSSTSIGSAVALVAAGLVANGIFAAAILTASMAVLSATIPSGPARASQFFLGLPPC